MLVVTYHGLFNKYLQSNMDVKEKMYRKQDTRLYLVHSIYHVNLEVLSIEELSCGGRTILCHQEKAPGRFLPSFSPNNHVNLMFPVHESCRCTAHGLFMDYER